MNYAIANSGSMIDQFDALMEEAEAQALIGQFGSDEQLEARVSKESGSGAYSSC
jgi:hypothetical protein